MRRFRRRRGREGQFEIQFHWIFALIGGILFLLFFLILLRSIITDDEERSARQIGFDVESVIAAAATSPETFHLTRVPTATYTFGCEEEAGRIRAAYIRINEQSYDQDSLRYVPLFSPRTLRGDQLFLLTTTLEAPFPVTNLVVASNNRTRYVYIGDPGSVNRFLQAHHLDAYGHDVVTSITNYPDEGYDQYRLIYFDSSPVFGSGFPGFLSQKATALTLAFDHDRKGGTATFYDDLVTPTGKAHRFIGEGMAVAAIFAGTSSSFTCNLAKAEERLATTITILQRRINALYPLVLSDCQTLLSEGTGSLVSYRSSLATGFTNVTAGPLISGGVAATLVKTNDALIAEGCPALY